MKFFIGVFCIFAFLHFSESKPLNELYDSLQAKLFELRQMDFIKQELLKPTAAPNPMPERGAKFGINALSHNVIQSKLHALSSGKAAAKPRMLASDLLNRVGFRRL